MLTFQKAVRDFEFALSAELPLAPSSTRRSIEQDIDALGDVVAAFQITDNPTGVSHMSPLVAAGICLENGKDAVLHLSGRDRNRIALQSDILGAAAAGVSSLLMLRGSKLPDDLTPPAHKVHEYGVKSLLRCAHLISEDLALVPAPGFFLGSLITVIEPQDDWQPRSIESKADAGCRFVQTQPLLDLQLLRRYMQRLVANRVIRRVSVIVTVPLLSSADQLNALLRRPWPALVPPDLTQSFCASRTPRDDGAMILRDTLDVLETIPGIAGANVVAIEDALAAAKAISLSGTSGWAHRSASCPS